MESWESKKEEVKTEAPVVVEPPKEEVKAQEPVQVEAKPQDSKKDQEGMVPQDLVGKVAKKIREKSKDKIMELQARLSQIEEENRRLKSGEAVENNSYNSEESLKIQQAVREDFLRRQDAYGREKYGNDVYNDALELVTSQKDQMLVAKIMGAANPADTLMREAQRIAEDIEFGSNPAEREKKKLDSLRSSWRQEWEAEVSERIKARGNQPTDVSHVRAAGGNEKGRIIPESWETTLPK